jgi:DnaJ-class molecular chaperone
MPERTPDPHCPECGGTGFATIHRPLMDRVDELSVPCPRCTPKAQGMDRAEPQDDGR